MGDSMSTIINATTTNGVVIQPDNSGSLVLQTNSGTTALTIDTLQNVAFAKGFTVGATAAPAFSAYLSTNQTISASTFTKVQCNIEEFDTNSNYDNATNYRFTPTVAGYYQVNGCITFGSTVSKVEFLASIYKNGSEFKRGVYVAINTANNQNCSVSALIYLNGSTDYVELYGYLDAVGSPRFGLGEFNTYFQAAMIRSA